MKISETALEEVVVIEPEVFGDKRGFFQETYHEKRYAEARIPGPFVQDSLSYSPRGVLRGLHFQNPNAQAKLVYVLEGEVFDAVVDVRPNSPTFRRWVGVRLSAKNRLQLYVPEGFAHGFCVTGETALFAYKSTDFYSPEAEVSIVWNDPDIGIDWPIEAPQLSPRDQFAPRLRDLDRSRLPPYPGAG